MSYNKQLCYNDLTQNHEGARAWRMTPEWELYTTVVTTMGTEDKFYENGEDRVRRIADLVRKVDAGFVAQLAVYAREEMHLRSVPMLLLVELANCHRGDSLVSRAVSRTVQRADEITELLMCYQWRMGKKNLHGLSSQLRKGLAEAFNRFDEYQFAKYNRTGRMVTLRDALLLVHPKPKDAAQADLFRKILNGNLETPYTWETELSAAGKGKFESAEKRDEALRETWQQLIRSGRLGYMAMMRNLSNMTNLCIDDESKRMVCRMLSDATAVRNSKQLPFRFLAAYLQLLHDVIPRPVQKDNTYDYWAVSAYYALCDRQNDLQEVLKLQKLEKQLENINKRLCALRAKCSVQNARADEKRRSAWRWFEKMRQSYMSQWKRRNKRMAHLGTTKASFVAPFLQALEKAVKYTADNIPGFDKNTRVLLASDTSSSMFQAVSQNSMMMCYHIGLFLSMLMYYRCENVVAGMFGDIWKDCSFSSDNILRNTVDMISREGEVGYSTNGYKVIDWLISENRVMDKVMLFTDCELWNSHNGGEDLAKSWGMYKRIAPDAKLYLFNLAGYGTSPVSMNRHDVYCIAGWSDKVFDILAALENGGNAIDMIRRIVV